MKDDECLWVLKLQPTHVPKAEILIPRLECKKDAYIIESIFTDFSKRLQFVHQKQPRVQEMLCYMPGVSLNTGRIFSEIQHEEINFLPIKWNIIL